MLVEVEFLFDNQLIAAVEKLIRKSQKYLLLVSPFIDLDARIMDALIEKKDRTDFQLLILFGKNENNYYKSITKDSLEFLKQFPNVEIRYNERLHAKFYQNDFEFIMTSLNLYDYSLANNIEVGVKGIYASKGILRKAIDATDDLLDQGIDKVKQNVFGIERDLDPLEKFQTIFKYSDLKYKTQPIQTRVSKKKLEGFKVLINNFDTISSATEKESQSTETVTTTITTQTVITQIHCISASQIAKKYKLQNRAITVLMEQKGYIKGDKITDAGKLKGLVIKTYKGHDYIAYPENLEELNELIKKI
jgi:hypothetical protein